MLKQGINYKNKKYFILDNYTSFKNFKWLGAYRLQPRLLLVV